MVYEDGVVKSRRVYEVRVSLRLYQPRVALSRDNGIPIHIQCMGLDTAASVDDCKPRPRREFWRLGRQRLIKLRLQSLPRLPTLDHRHSNTNTFHNQLEYQIRTSHTTPIPPPPWTRVVTNRSLTLVVLLFFHPPPAMRCLSRHTRSRGRYSMPTRPPCWSSSSSRNTTETGQFFESRQGYMITDMKVVQSPCNHHPKRP